METIKDLSGNKKHDRLIYMVSVNDTTKYVKITPNSEIEYNAEIDIYKELNSYMENDEIIKNKILKICNNDIIENICSNIQLQLYENIVCNLSYEYSKNIKKLYTNNNNEEKNYKLQYLVTDYDNNFSSIQDDPNFFIAKYSKHPKKFHNLLERLFTTLIYLNRNFGFVHWDLHIGNLLINKKSCSRFLLYDFDMSETNTVTNNAFIERYMETINGCIDIDTNIETINIGNNTYYEKRKIYGLATDFLTFFLGCQDKLVIDINVDYFKSSLIRKIVTEIKNIKYNNKHQFFDVIIPTVCEKLITFLNL